MLGRRVSHRRWKLTGSAGRVLDCVLREFGVVGFVEVARFLSSKLCNSPPPGLGFIGLGFAELRFTRVLARGNGGDDTLHSYCRVFGVVVIAAKDDGLS